MQDSFDPHQDEIDLEEKIEQVLTQYGLRHARVCASDRFRKMG
jgi:hypothetical protein